MKRLLSLLLAVCLLCACTALAENDLYDLFPLDGEPITLNVYSQLANYSGIQTGWSAQLLLDRFNVKVNIIPDQDGVYETRVASGNLGDIVVWGANGDDYKNAVNQGLLLDWEEDDLGEIYAPYIWENYQSALQSNRTISGDDTIHGFGFNIALSDGESTGEQARQSFFYTCDIRWDLYKQLGYPEINTLDDLIEVFKQMKEICPTDEKGNETYAASIWPDWDGNMVMYVKALATAYYGYDELGFGLYNPTNGEFYSCLDEDGPYMECLKFFNKLYRENLLDPASMTQKYDNMSEKVKNGGAFWGIFNYASSMAYNTEEHLSAGKMMYACVPNEASPIVYGMSDVGGSRIWSIGADTEYPELCLAILDYLATPEGSMTMWYGPKGLTWDYDENGGHYFTELGKKTSSDSKYDLTGVEWTSNFSGKTYVLSGNFNDGCLQINNTTLTNDMVDPDSAAGEAFNKDTWASELTAASYEIYQDWRDYTGCMTSDQYMSGHNYLVMPDIPYSESAKDAELSVIWSQVAKTIVNYSWRAIYAKNDGEFNYHISEMRKMCNQYGFDKCLEWCNQEAAIKWQLTQDLNK